MGANAAEQALANAGGIPTTYTNREAPQHNVTVRSFAAGRYAVTRGEFGVFVRATAYKSRDLQIRGCHIVASRTWQADVSKNWHEVGFEQTDAHPVVCVSWNDAQAYVKWISKIAGKPYRLLSEAEREYVTRAGTKTAFWWGDEINTSRANYNGNGIVYNNSPKGESRKATVPVNSFDANPFGLYNVHGNVWEWVEDCIHEDYASDPPTDGTAWKSGCQNEASAIVRGGAWYTLPAELRGSHRGRSLREGGFTTNGFRVARDF